MNGLWNEHPLINQGDDIISIIDVHSLANYSLHYVVRKWQKPSKLRNWFEKKFSTICVSSSSSTSSFSSPSAFQKNLVQSTVSQCRCLKRQRFHTEIIRASKTCAEGVASPNSQVTHKSHSALRYASLLSKATVVLTLVKKSRVVVLST